MKFEFRENNFDINPINLDIPVESQGPYDCIIHKITDLIAKAENGDLIVKKQVDNFKVIEKNEYIYFKVLLI